MCFSQRPCKPVFSKNTQKKRNEFTAKWLNSLIQWDDEIGVFRNTLFKYLLSAHYKTAECDFLYFCFQNCVHLKSHSVLNLITFLQIKTISLSQKPVVFMPYVFFTCSKGNWLMRSKTVIQYFCWICEKYVCIYFHNSVYGFT